MKKLPFRRFAFGIALGFVAASAHAAQKTIDLSAGCKLYKLRGKAWKAADGSAMDGFSFDESQILRDETFTVFKAPAGTYGLNRKCIRDAEAPAPRRAAAPIPIRGDLKTPWSAVFSIGYNLSPKGKVTTTFRGTTSEVDTSFKSSFAFLGEGNYRMARTFRLALELGLSQLTTSEKSGNDTSFIDFRPEFVLPLGKSQKFEAYLGPMIGLFFLSQTKYTQEDVVAVGIDVDVKQQTKSAFLLGLGFGLDYALNSQFDLGLFFRYMKPGSFTLTGTETTPVAGNVYEAKIETSYLMSGLRFAIHF